MTTLIDLTEWLAAELNTLFGIPVILNYPGYGRPLVNEKAVSFSLVRLAPASEFFGAFKLIADYTVSIHIADEYDFQSLLSNFLSWMRQPNELANTEVTIGEGNRVEYQDLEVGGSRFDFIISINF